MTDPQEKRSLIEVVQNANTYLQGISLPVENR